MSAFDIPEQFLDDSAEEDMDIDPDMYNEETEEEKRNKIKHYIG